MGLGAEVSVILSTSWFNAYVMIIIQPLEAILSSWAYIFNEELGLHFIFSKTNLLWDRSKLLWDSASQSPKWGKHHSNI